MHEIYELKEMLCEELEKYGAKGDLSAGELEIVDKLAHTVKNLGKIIEMYEEEEEYSGNMSYQRGGNRGNQGGSNRGSYEGRSYARGRNARRDSRGRYSSEGYSRAADDMKAQLRELMEQAPNEMTRRELEKLVERMEQM